MGIASFVSNPPPSLLEDLVLSLDDDATIAARYGLTLTEFEQVKSHPVFLSHLNRTKQNLDKTGELPRAKARYLFDEALITAHAKLVTDPSVRPKELIQWVETLASIGEIYNKSSKELLGKVTEGGPKFVLNIMLSKEDKQEFVIDTKDKNIIEAKAENVEIEEAT